MIFGGRSLYELSNKDFETLVQSNFPEGQTLEFKERAYEGDINSIREMLRDIVAFANAVGGYLILGIRKDEFGRAESIVPVLSVFEKARSIYQLCIDGINDRIEGLEVKAFEFSPDQGIIAIRIPNSENRPHMVIREQSTDFYGRYETDVREMTIEEIRFLVLTNPTNLGLVELELLACGKVIRPNQRTYKSRPPYARIFTERSVDQFIQKYLQCNTFPQTLVIVSPYISDLAGGLVELKDIVDKINHDKTITYIITRPPKAQYQHDSIEILSKSIYTEIRYNDDIHAKLYICWCRKEEYQSFALFGSGNLTSSGIRQNLELGMMIYSKDHGRNLIRNLFEWSTVGLRSQSKRVKQLTLINTNRRI